MDSLGHLLALLAPRCKVNLLPAGLLAVAGRPGMSRCAAAWYLAFCVCVAGRLTVGKTDPADAGRRCHLAPRTDRRT